MSRQGNATEVETNSVDKEKSSGDKTESLKRPVSEVNDTGKEDSKQKQQKTGKDEKPNGVYLKVKEDDDDEDVDSKDEDEDDVAGEGEGEDFDEEEGDDDVADEEGDEDDEDDA